MSNYTSEKSFLVAKACFAAGVREVFISPGSRNAPLSVAFSRSNKFKIHIIPDERSAGYMALGASLATKQPVCAITTSGTAATNLYPAITEAFYQNIPLIALTADRPPELIDQLDGQAIRQVSLFENHIKKDLNIGIDHDLDSVFHEILEMIQLAKTGSKGPVHINLPFEEPLYKFLDTYEFDVDPLSEIPHVIPQNSEIFIEKINEYERILILPGQGDYSEEVIRSLKNLAKKGYVIIGDITSNLNEYPELISFNELLIPDEKLFDLKAIQPDLLISFGNSIISKNLRLGLRKMNIKEHWHIISEGSVPDPYFTKPVAIYDKVENILSKIEKVPTRHKFKELWHQLGDSQANKLQTFLKKNEFFELTAIQMILETLPDNSTLHLGNSLPVRYANWVGIRGKNNILVQSNRGTSGIDGCVSTAVGHALADSDKLNVLIIGDMSFFYDRNGLWADTLPTNLKIIVMNNHGGGIFRMIDGPENLKERDSIFTAMHHRSAENTAKDAGLIYINSKNEEDLKNDLQTLFFEYKESALLEVETDMNRNTQLFRALREEMNKFSL